MVRIGVLKEVVALSSCSRFCCLRFMLVDLLSKWLPELSLLMIIAVGSIPLNIPH